MDPMLRRYYCDQLAIPIENRILTLRGKQAMIDRDLTEFTPNALICSSLLVFQRRGILRLAAIDNYLKCGGYGWGACR